MITTDLALIGRLGESAVAAAALAHTVYFVSFTFGLGLMAAVSPLAAQAFGAGDVRRIRRSLRVGLWVALLISLPMMASPLYGEHILIALGQAPHSAALAQRYLNGLAWGIAPALGFIALRSMMSAVNRPQAPLWITLAAIPVNAALVYVLIHGLFGLPELGLFGAGLATTLVNLGTFVATLAIAGLRKPFADYRPLAHLWRIDWPLMRELIAIGAPISFSLLLEYGLFSSAALLMGLISTTALAAHQIALQVTAVLFMVPLGIGMAATVRVGHAFGRGEPLAVKRAGLVAAVIGIAFVSALTVAIILAFFAPWPWNLIAVVGGLGIEAVELTWGLRLARRWRPQTGAEAMIGQVAEVVAPCHPTGQVRGQGDLLEARCANGADAGQSVRIDGLDGLSLVVVPGCQHQSANVPSA